MSSQEVVDDSRSVVSLVFAGMPNVLLMEGKGFDAFLCTSRFEDSLRNHINHCFHGIMFLAA